MFFHKLLGSPTREEWKRPSIWVLLLANFLPVLGVLFLGWEVLPLLLLFWVENVIIGVVNVIKMITSSADGLIGHVGKAFFVPFFCVHYGGFTAVHGLFVLLLFGGGVSPPGKSFDQIIQSVPQIIEENHLFWPIVALATSHGFSLVMNYFLAGQYRNQSLQTLMVEPYGRVILLHVTIILGGMLVAWLRSPLAGLLFLVALKTLLDLRGHVWEQRKAQSPKGSS